MANINNYFIKNKNLKPLIIAEISANHCGKKSLFLKTIKAAAINGADLIKIQTYEAEDITIKSNLKIKGKILNTWKLYNKAQTPFHWHDDAFKLAKKLKVELFSTPFSVRAVNFLKKFNVKLFKISSFEITDINLILNIAKTRKPVIISTGMASIKDIKNCIKTINKYHNKIILLHCVSGYPTNEDQANLNRIKNLKRLFPKYNIGLSDHTNNEWFGALAASYGVRVFEKHVKLKKFKSFDYKFSLDLVSFKKYVSNIHDVIREKKKQKIKFKTRKIFSRENLKKGQAISLKNLIFYRSDEGIEEYEKKKNLGKKLKVNIIKDHLILPKHLN